MAIKRIDLSSVLDSLDGGFLIRNNGDRVEVENFKGKTLGLYFSASWCGPCRRFTPSLVEAYNEITQAGQNFEILFVSSDHDDESFNAYFSKMPWLAIPFSDSATREKLKETFRVDGIPHLVLFGENGKVLTKEGVSTIGEYESDGFPFTPEHIKKLEEHAADAKKDQSLKSLLVTKSRDYVIAPDGKKVPVSELEGKTVGLYFSMSAFRGSKAFDPRLIEVYKALKEEGHSFEIIMIPLDEIESVFQEYFEKLPWLSLPSKDKLCLKLAKYFDLEDLPTVVAIGADGKTLHPNVAEAIYEHGANAFPFTPEKFVELEQIEKARLEAQTLESILVLKDLDFVIGKDGIKVPVSNLVGKTVLLYFSAEWCPPCRAFLPSLIKAYQEINKNGNTLEVIFISSDGDQKSFNEFFSGMPWLALPFGDERKKSLARLFKVKGIPMVIAIAPSGRTITTDARGPIESYGARAYPFTTVRLEEIKAEDDKMAEDWPSKLKVEAHEHELVLTERKSFYCDKCGSQGSSWSFYCKRCDFDLHPQCAFEEESVTNKKEEALEAGKEADEKWICDGDVCKKE